VGWGRVYGQDDPEAVAIRALLGLRVDYMETEMSLEQVKVAVVME
jgi:hypothetical protein